MKIKITINTPTGNANSNEKRVRKKIIGNPKKLDSFSSTINKKDNQIVFEAEGTFKQLMKIQNRAITFDKVVQAVFANKLIKKATDNRLSEEDKAEMVRVLNDHVNIDILDGE